MSEIEEWAEFRRARGQVLTLYIAVVILAIVGAGALALYCYELGPLVGPGVESSFGFAVALMFLLGALIVHVVDRMQRAWPLGRRFAPAAPGPVTDLDWAHVVEVVILVTAGGAIAYVLGGILA